MKILVTGGAGFIGSHLTESLLSDGHEVTVFDNLSTGNKANLRAVKNHKKLNFIKGSVLDLRALTPLVKKTDQIYHLAAAVGVKVVVEKPLESLIANLDGTKNILELAESRGCPVLIASTSEVYGKNPNIPFAEDADRVYGSVYRERWGYALSKAVDEFMGLQYWRERKLPTVIVRFFNTTGPRQSSMYGMVIPTFVAQALANKPLKIHGDGKQFRSFGHVSDVVWGVKNLLNSPKAYGEIFNLGANEPITINELAKKIKTMTGSKSKIIHIPYAKAYNKNFEDMRGRVPDISKAKKIVGYDPAYSLNDILASTIEYAKSK